MSEQYSAGIDLFNNIQDLLSGKITFDYISLQFASDNCQYLLAMALFMTRFSLPVSIFLFILYILSFGGLVTKKVIEEENIKIDEIDETKDYYTANKLNDRVPLEHCEGYNSQKNIDLKYITPFIIILFALFTKILYKFPRSLSTGTILVFLVLVFFQRFIIFIIHDIALRITVNSYCSTNQLCSFKEEADNNDPNQDYITYSSIINQNKLSYRNRCGVFPKIDIFSEIYDSCSSSEFTVLMVLITFSIIRFGFRYLLYTNNKKITDIYYYIEPYLNYFDKLQFKFDQKFLKNKDIKLISESFRLIIIILYYYFIPNFIEKHIKTICKTETKNFNLNLFQKIITFIPLLFLIKNIDPKIKSPIHTMCPLSLAKLVHNIEDKIDNLESTFEFFKSDEGFIRYPRILIWDLMIYTVLWNFITKTILTLLVPFIDVPQLLICKIISLMNDLKTNKWGIGAIYLMKMALNLFAFILTYQIIKHIYISTQCFKKPLCINKKSEQPDADSPLNDSNINITWTQILNFDKDNIFDSTLKFIIFICTLVLLVLSFIKAIPAILAGMKYLQKMIKSSNETNAGTVVPAPAPVSEKIKQIHNFLESFNKFITTKFDRDAITSDNIIQKKIDLIHKYIYKECYKKSEKSSCNSMLSMLSKLKKPLDLARVLQPMYIKNIDDYLNDILDMIISNTKYMPTELQNITNLSKYKSDTDITKYNMLDVIPLYYWTERNFKKHKVIPLNTQRA